MALNQSYATWLKENVGDNIASNSRYVLKVSSRTNQGVENFEFEFEFDLCWFILLHVESSNLMKLQVVQSLLSDQNYLVSFQNTAYNAKVKRLLEEFLLFNYQLLDGLKAYLDFTQLDIPLDFISHALFIKRSLEDETKEINEERLKIVNTILDTGFNLPDYARAKDSGAAVKKVLFMENVMDRFKVASRMLQVGFKLFTDNNVTNTETALLLIDDRNNSDCLTIIMQSVDSLRSLRLQLSDNDAGNLADYYYWVKEDMDAVRFLKETLSLKLSSATNKQ